MAASITPLYPTPKGVGVYNHGKMSRFKSEAQRKAVFAKLRNSPKAKKFISRKIKKNIEEGKPQKQSVAIAFSQARKKGFKVPKKAVFFDGKRFR